jgi:hypothetical protein
MQPDIALKLLESGGVLLYNPVTKASTTEAIVVPLGKRAFLPGNMKRPEARWEGAQSLNRPMGSFHAPGNRCEAATGVR